MMKHEFEKLINDTVNDEDYAKIEAVYMTCDHLFTVKEDIAEFYMLNGIEVIENLLKECEYTNRLRTSLDNANGRNMTLELEVIRLNRLLISANLEIANLKEEREKVERENKMLNSMCERYDVFVRTYYGKGDCKNE